MMSLIRKIACLAVGLFTSVLVMAKDGENGVEMADLMRSNGKIYVVVAVVVTILVGLIIYMVRLDRKMSRLEKEK